jgi:hypothetical protein
MGGASKPEAFNSCPFVEIEAERTSAASPIRMTGSSLKRVI